MQLLRLNEGSCYDAALSTCSATTFTTSVAAEPYGTRAWHWLYVVPQCARMHVRPAVLSSMWKVHVTREALLKHQVALPLSDC